MFNRRLLIEPLITARITVIEDNLLPRHPNYRKLQEQIGASQQIVKEHLPEESLEAFWDWDALSGSLLGLTGEIMYRQGFVDGLRLAREVRKLSR